ncbi:MAG: glycosyltransferase family 4 protein [Elusimicrobia bacterium]|nr:glycosyltransferase family 4 protein [Elusimicrobiota bacterium]
MQSQLGVKRRPDPIAPDPLIPKIKVLHLITKLEFGGAQQNTLYTVGHLDKERFEVYLACGRGGYLDEKAENLSETVKMVWLRFLKRPIRPWWDFAAFIELIFCLRRIKPDIIHTHSSKAGILGRWAAWLCGVKVIVHTFHGFGFHDFQPAPVRLTLAFSERLTAKITAALIFVSKSNIEYAGRWKIKAKTAPLLIRSGVDLEAIDQTADEVRIRKRKELDIAPDAPIIVTVGNLKPQKNPEHFIELSRRLRERCPQAVFIFIGGWEGKGAKEKIFANAPANLRYLGWRQDVRLIFKAGDIFVLTSLWEGLPRSAVEAMRTGLPVAAYATDGLREVIKEGDNGYLAPPGNLDSLEKSLSRLLDDAGLRRRMGKSAQESIGPEFDINDMVRRQEKLYAQLTGIS